MTWKERRQQRKQKSLTDKTEYALNALLDFLGVDSNVDSSALSESVYFACQKVLSESLGKLPLKIQQYQPQQGIRIAREHKYYRMLNERPNRYMSASAFWSMMELFRNHYGNAYALIDVRNMSKPQLFPLHPDNVTVVYDDKLYLGDIPDVYYKYTTGVQTFVFKSEEILHFRSHLTDNGITGISVREQLKSTINGNAKAQKLINKMFDNGMTAKAVLQYTGSLNPENVEMLTRGLEAYAKGELRDKGIENIIPIPLGMNLQPLNVKLADSQFVEIRQYTSMQIASAFGIKPYQIGDYTKSSYASAEAQQLSFLVDTLLFIIKQYEEEISYKLLTDSEEANGYHAKFNTAVILRADQKTQIETLSSAVSNFLYTPNEARELLNLPAKEGGDNLLGNGASIPVQYAGSQYTDISSGEEEKSWIKKILTEALAEMKTE